MRSPTRLGLISLLVMILLSPVGSALAGSPINPLTEQDVARVDYVGEVVINPDGNSVAYIRNVQRDPMAPGDGPAHRELHIVGPDGVSLPFITGKETLRALQWTPDGAQVSFIAKRKADKIPALYRIPLHGGEAQVVLRHTAGIGSYVWSPDGRHVAFLGKAPKSAAVKAMAKKGFQAIVYEESVKAVLLWFSEVRRADGTWIAVKDQKVRRFNLTGSASDLQYGPTGDQLSVALAPTPLIDDHYMNRKIHVIDIKSGKSKKSFPTTGKIGPVRWSPDGKHLAILAAGDRHDPSAARLMLGSVKTGKLSHPLGSSFDGDVLSVGWRDADTMVYIATRGVWNELLEIRTDGSAPRTIVEKGGPIFHGLSVSTDGAIAATIANSPSHPKEAYTVRLQSGQVRRTTTHNPWLKAKSFGNQQVVNYKARDGMDIEGLLIHPVAGTNKGTAPLIVMVHGGPEAHYSNGWITNYSTPGQVAAGRGFAVLYPNYRGSTGRGVAFAKGDHGDPAGREFDDLLDGVAHLDKKGLIDKKRVGITGGSYGGYASAWGATAHTEHYAASVVFVGVSNQISKVGTTDIPNEMKLVHFLQYAWDNWDFFLKRSPVYHADKCKTPTLILHGKADTRVDPGQSRELYRHIKMRGNAPVRLVLYPGEGHGNRKAANRYDYNLRMMRWMEHYLKGDGKEMPALSPEYAPSTKAATSKRKKRGKNRKKR